MKFANNSLLTTSLTPTLSRWERENRAPSASTTESGDCSRSFRVNQSRRFLFPLPRGEGQGEDESEFHLNSNYCVVCQSAFTLLELLLAVLVFAIVLGAIHVVFFSAIKLRNKTSDAIERSLPLQQTLMIIKRDLANLVPPGGTLSGALQSAPTVFPAPGGSTNTGAGSSMSGSLNRGNGPDFYTAVGLVNDAAPWGEIERVSYRLAQPTNNAPGMDLVRSVARNLLPAMQVQTQDQFLMGGVEAITFQYYDGNAWKDTWDSTQVDSATGLANNLPRAIKLDLQLHTENNGAGTPAPVELIVPLLVLARTNLTATIQ